MTDKTKAGALFGVKSTEKAEAAAVVPINHVEPIPPNLPPELLAMVQQMMSGQLPLGQLFGGQVSPLQQRQQERRELAKALLVSMANGGLTLDYAEALAQSDRLLSALEVQETAERAHQKEER